MCGIVGYITLKDDTNIHSKDKFFTEALFTDTLRGHDSTGIVTIEEEFRWHWQKQCVAAPKFISSKGFHDRELKTWCAVGHNRSATRGEVSTDNSHPFQHESIILVHNGTMRTTYSLEHQDKKIEVDSELIAYNLSKTPVEDAHKVLSKLNGAYALVWLDERDQSVNFARNSERPFHIATTKDEDCLYFASDGSRIWQIATNQHLKYKKGNLVPEVTPVNPFIPVTTYHSNWRGGGTGGTDRDTYSVGYKQSGHRAKHGKALIAGEIQDIPSSMETILTQWYSFKMGQEYMFKPESFECFGKDNLNGLLHGKVWHPEWGCFINAYVTECTKYTMKTYADREWTAIPMGVDHTDHCDESKNPLTIIMGVKNHTWLGDKIEDTSHTCEDVDEVEHVKGPHGDITLEAWTKLTEAGCAMCAGPLFIEDHDVMLWIGEMQNQPMCPGCFDAATIGSRDDSYTTD